MPATIDQIAAEQLPAPEDHEVVRPLEGPLPLAFGARTVRQLDEWTQRLQADPIGQRVSDYVKDPRNHREGDKGHASRHAVTEGYITEAMLDRSPDDTAAIDAYYGSMFDDSFYDRHGIERGKLLSDILRDALHRDENGHFTVSKEQYLAFLSDIVSAHVGAERAFAETLPGAITYYANRLAGSKLAYILPTFSERIKHTTIRLDDGFSTVIHGNVGQHFNEDGYKLDRDIKLAPGEGAQTLHHEFGHMVQGNGLAATFSNAPNFVVAMREGLPEWTAAYLTNGGDIQHLAYSSKDEVYLEYLDIVDLLANGGKKQISIHDFIKTDIAHLTGPNEALLAAIAKSFPDHPDIISKLNTLLGDMRAVGATDESKELAVADMVTYMNEVKRHYAQKNQRLGARVVRVASGVWNAKLPIPTRRRTK